MSAASSGAIKPAASVLYPFSQKRMVQVAGEPLSILNVAIAIFRHRGHKPTQYFTD
jgi:hypothetical protein